ncbi:MAG TPA: acetate/propionate family kinase [Planctomycetota bacterium]|jgi:acetate kinase
MNILAFNCGSSSLKYRLISMPSEEQIAGGEAQRVGPKTAEPSRIVHTERGGKKETFIVEMRDHGEAFQEVRKLLAARNHAQADIFSHRLAHGGLRFGACTRLDAQAMADLPPLGELAPLHNPPAIALMQACHQYCPTTPQAVVCDTAYHAEIPDYARTYALPKSIREGMGIRKFGFHGISHAYVVAEAARFLNKPLEKFNAVSCHLGSGGASLCAVVNGRSVDNTMGYSPLQGLVMSTRCGDLDPAIVMHLLSRAKGNPKSVESELNRKSGVLGMSGMSADIRDVLKAAAKGGEDAGRLDLAAQIYLWRIRKYLGSYLAVVGRTDAVLFTDTIGELVPHVRWACCTNMEAFGLKIDAEKNENVTTWPTDVAAGDSAVRILTLLTNEELLMARKTYALMNGTAA